MVKLATIILLLCVCACEAQQHRFRRPPFRYAAAAAGSGAGPFIFIASAEGASAAAGITTINASSALNLASGDLVVVWTEWQDGETGNTVVVDENDGTDTFTATDAVVNTSDVGGTFNYLLNAPADASFTVRTTISASSRRIELVAFQFRPTTAPAALDASTTPATGSGTAVASAAITTSVNNGVVIGGSAHASGTTTTELINAVTRDAKLDATSYCSSWYRTNALFTAGTASATVGASDLWVGGVIAFK